MWSGWFRSCQFRKTNGKTVIGLLDKSLTILRPTSCTKLDHIFIYTFIQSDLKMCIQSILLQILPISFCFQIYVPKNVARLKASCDWSTHTSVKQSPPEVIRCNVHKILWRVISQAMCDITQTLIREHSHPYKFTLEALLVHTKVRL